MSASAITFVRHGSLPQEYSCCFTGVNDIPLNPAGIRESEAIGRYLVLHRYSSAYSGTLRRVTETWREATRFAHNLPDPVLDPRLNEMDFGQWSLIPFPKLREMYPKDFFRWSFGEPEFTFPGGGKVADFTTRTREAFAEIREKGGNHPVIFSHGGVIMSLMADLLQMPRSEAFSVWIARGGIAELRRGNASRWQLTALFRPRDFETGSPESRNKQAL